MIKVCEFLFASSGARRNETIKKNAKREKYWMRTMKERKLRGKQRNEAPNEENGNIAA